MILTQNDHLLHDKSQSVPIYLHFGPQMIENGGIFWLLSREKIIKSMISRFSITFEPRCSYEIVLISKASYFSSFLAANLLQKRATFFLFDICFIVCCLIAVSDCWFLTIWLLPNCSAGNSLKIVPMTNFQAKGSTRSQKSKIEPFSFWLKFCT